MAFIADLKFNLALPFHRQEGFVQGLGLPLVPSKWPRILLKLVKRT